MHEAFNFLFSYGVAKVTVPGRAETWVQIIDLKDVSFS